MTRWIVLAGEIGSGKTTAVLAAVELLAERGVQSLGVVGQPVIGVAGRRVGIDAVDLGSGRRRRLAAWVGSAGQVCPAYEFKARAFAWARAALRGALAARPELLVLDEIGPLELRHEQGYSEVLDALLRADTPRVLVVVREPLLPLLLERLFGRELTVLHLTADNRDQAPEQIQREVLRSRV